MKVSYSGKILNGCKTKDYVYSKDCKSLEKCLEKINDVKEFSARMNPAVSLCLRLEGKYEYAKVDQKKINLCFFSKTKFMDTGYLFKNYMEYIEKNN